MLQENAVVECIEWHKKLKKHPSTHKYAIVHASSVGRYVIQNEEVNWWLVCWETKDSESGKRF